MGTAASNPLTHNHSGVVTDASTSSLDGPQISSSAEISGAAADVVSSAGNVTEAMKHCEGNAEADANQAAESLASYQNGEGRVIADGSVR